ncbi:hypothetical protein PQR57_48145, partial [Paraburkholderia dipogonis]
MKEIRDGLIDLSTRADIVNMTIFLALLLLNVFVLPFAVSPTSVFAHVMRDLLLSFMLLSGAVTALDRRRTFIVIAAIAFGAIHFRWSEWALPFDKGGGAVVLYIMVGVIWAEDYQLIALHTPGSFVAGSQDARCAATRLDLPQLRHAD